jgi:UDP-N-acetylglucosamine pyrophosphorylase
MISYKDAEFLMEVTDKTKADVKGGTLVGKSSVNKINAQCPEKKTCRLRRLDPSA